MVQDMKKQTISPGSYSDSKRKATTNDHYTRENLRVHLNFVHKKNNFKWFSMLEKSTVSEEFQTVRTRREN
jgi:hypothetical protein